MITAHKFLASGYSIALCTLLVGCGGGDSSTPTTNTNETTNETMRSVSGSVPGTLIEAFCKDGGYYSVTSTDNGSTQHPFTMNLPVDVDCKLIMTTNEDDPDVTKHIITPILFNNTETTSSYVRLTDDIDLGYIDLPMAGTGIQTPLVLTLEDAKVQLNTFTYDPLDDDHDDIPNVYEDDDGDGLYNKYDDDDDNDGIKDRDDSDYANDSDGDGVTDDYDSDDDNDMIRDKDDDDDKDEYSKDDDDDDDKDEYSKDDDDDDDKDDYYTDNTNTATIVLPTSYTPNAGRLLGAQCAQCHGTNGVSVNKWDSIAGEDNLHEEMFEDDAPIMMAQARGYTRDEITLMESWFQTLTKYKD